GTPASSGTASFALSIGGKTCTLTRTVNDSLAHTCGAPNVHNPAKTYGTMTDQQGNVYKTIVIGTQEWMAENLNTSRYRNGDIIPTGLNNNAWSTTTAGAWNYLTDDSSFACPYGKNYNWYACADSRNLCPTGWHVPTDLEWSTLINLLDPNANGGANPNIAGGTMKTTGTIQEGNGLWNFPNSGASNNSGFSGVPVGYRNSLGSYFNNGNSQRWWSNTQNTTDNSLAITRILDYNSDMVTRNANFGKRNGFSVRCIKDNSSYGVINSLDCGTAINNGTLNQGVFASGVSSVISYTGGNGGSYNTTITASTGVTGLTATVVGGNFALGNGTLTYTITGSPSSGGNAVFELNIGGKTCTLTRLVIGQNIVGTHTCGANYIHNPSLNYGTMTDQSGYTYKTITINNKEWMAENLKTYRYRNGDNIPVVSDDSGWNLALLTGYSCFVQNDSVNKNCPYGKLYNHYAVTDARGLCPTGWHGPDNSEWNSLNDALNNASNPNISGGKMKSTGTVEALNGVWKAPNTDATNSSGFSGIPGGYRTLNGPFVGPGFYGYWWSSQVGGTNAASTHYLSYDNNSLFGNSFDRRAGCSVRCVKD
ncbi:MAG: FISUMP domain-containing protein, partial [Bacteroidota bacterium]